MVGDQLLDEHLLSFSMLCPWFVDIAHYLVAAKISPKYVIEGEE